MLTTMKSVISYWEQNNGKTIIKCDFAIFALKYIIYGGKNNILF